MEIKTNKILIRDPDTKKYEPFLAIQGESAYEIAKKYGYKGTEEEWANEVINTQKANLEAIHEAGAMYGGIAVSPTEPTNENVDAWVIDGGEVESSNEDLLQKGDLLDSTIYTESEKETFRKAYDIIGADDIVQELGNEVDKVPSVAVTKDVTDNLNKRLTSAEQKIELGLDEGKITENAVLATEKWLSEHPEKTTTVQDGSIEDKKFTDDLKKKVIKDYVTPEMFKAVGDGVTDDTKAIQDAIDTNKPCLLSGTYKIDSPINIIKNDQTLIIDGELKVKGSVGIIISGMRNVITGKGCIKIGSVADSETISTGIKIVVKGDIYESSNEISVKLIESVAYTINNIGIEITGDPVANTSNTGGGCFDKIYTTVKLCRYGIWLHETKGQPEKVWYTAMDIDSVFNGCIQDVVMDWQGGGSLIRGSAQPLYSSSERLPTGFNRGLPLFKIAENCYMNSFIWDMMNTTANLYAIEVTGAKCTIIPHAVEEKYILVPIEYKASLRIESQYAKKQFGVATRAHWGINSTVAFDNTNDILLNCFDNSNVTPKLGTVDNGYFGTFSTTREYACLFDGTNTAIGWHGTADLPYLGMLFEFVKPISLRHIAIWGDALADKFTFEVLLSGADKFVEIGTLIADVDYMRVANGQSRCASWSYDYIRDHVSLGGLSVRNVKELKIKMYFTSGKKYSLTRISAFDVAADILKKSGGTMTGDLNVLTPTKESHAVNKKYVDKYVNDRIGYATPEMYGAVGDGKTDDTDKLQQCINENANIELTGKYFISKTLEINSGHSYGKSLKTIRGGTIVVGGDFDGVVVKGSGITLEDVSISYSIDLYDYENRFVNYYHALLTLHSNVNSERTIITQNNIFRGIKLYPPFDNYSNTTLNMIAVKITIEGEGYCYNNTFSECKIYGAETAFLVENSENSRGCNANLYDVDVWHCMTMFNGKIGGSLIRGNCQSVMSPDSVLFRNFDGSENLIETFFYDVNYNNENNRAFLIDERESSGKDNSFINNIRSHSILNYAGKNRYNFIYEASKPTFSTNGWVTSSNDYVRVVPSTNALPKCVNTVIIEQGECVIAFADSGKYPDFSKDNQTLSNAISLCSDDVSNRVIYINTKAEGKESTASIKIELQKNHYVDSIFLEHYALYDFSCTINGVEMTTVEKSGYNGLVGFINTSNYGYANEDVTTIIISFSVNKMSKLKRISAICSSNDHGSY